VKVDTQVVCFCETVNGCFRIANCSTRINCPHLWIIVYLHSHLNPLDKGLLLKRWWNKVFSSECAVISPLHRNSSQTWIWPLLESNPKCTPRYIRDILVYDYSNWNSLEWDYSETWWITSLWQSVFSQCYVIHAVHMLPENYAPSLLLKQTLQCETNL